MRHLELRHMSSTGGMAAQNAATKMASPQTQPNGFFYNQQSSNGNGVKHTSYITDYIKTGKHMQSKTKDGKDMVEE